MLTIPCQAFAYADEGVTTIERVIVTADNE